jgi:hypothetical protein
VIVFVVARSRLDRYEELRRKVGGWTDAGVVLDRREGDRRTPDRTFAGVDRRRVERRHRLNVAQELSKLGWSVVDTDEPV